MTAVCPRMFDILTTLTFGAERRKSQCVNSIRGPPKKNKKTMKPRRTRGQQCIMKYQEHNRSKKRTLREKKIKIRRP